MPQIRARISLEWGWLEYDAAGPTVQIEDRLLPQAMHAHFTGGGVQPALDMYFGVVNGVPQCRGLTMRSVDGGREIRTLDLRAVQVETWLTKMFWIAALRVADEHQVDGGTAAICRCRRSQTAR